ncbi:P-selectin-like isoform X2 [Amphiura filiformis]|uniref:P-selectin-like isoform X2 n=1 Tax=Amphiura filiformis TaxID=82378 RepID=UPI003B20BCD5
MSISTHSRRFLTTFAFAIIVAVTFCKAAVTIPTEPPPQCPPLPIFTHGHMNAYSHGYIIYYFCDLGFTLWGAETLHCGVNGQWSDPPPICVAVTGCKILPMLDNGQTSYTFKGAVATFGCDSGYRLSTPSKSIYCDGTRWNDTMPTCQTTKNHLKTLPISNCPYPPTVQNATMEVTNEAVLYQCQGGSLPTVGAEKLECGVYGHWKSLPVVCAKIGCAIPEAPTNGFIIRKFSNAMLEFRCYDNFVLQGHSLIFCNGVTWNNTVIPTCVPIDTAIQNPSAARDVIVGGTRCLNAPFVQNSMVKYQRLTDLRGVLYWSAKFICQSGHRLSGEPEIYCSEGKWIGKPPVCVFQP